MQTEIEFRKNGKVINHTKQNSKYATIQHTRNSTSNATSNSTSKQVQKVKWKENNAYIEILHTHNLFFRSKTEMHTECTLN